MGETFYGCTSLTTIPTIPNSVTYISHAFKNCISLTGSIVINANNVQYYTSCFENTSTNNGCNLVVSGTCPQLDDIIATKSSNLHITKGQ